MSLGLHYGRSSRPLAYVVPDACHPGMWRVLGLDGALSDMVNLSRAKDAAAAIAERGPPARDRRRFRWLQERSKWAVDAPPIVPIDEPARVVAGVAQ